MLEKIKTPSDIKKLDVNDLDKLAKDIRQLILDTVLQNGGHLASNLGVVDLIVALNYVFDVEKDKFIYDVGHQCYAHKILTGRKDEFHTLRQKGGISGFPKRKESQYDIANTGHASTSISLSCGYAYALSKRGDFDSEIISIIGDGSLTGGLTHEALNSVSLIDKRQIIVINDNEMSISKSVGATAVKLVHFHNNSMYNSLKFVARKILTDFNYDIDNTNAMEFALNVRKTAKYFLQNGLPFDTYGIQYFGPINGHDINTLVETFNEIKKSKESCIVHIVTKKGRGFKEAEDNPQKYHGYSAENNSNIKTFSNIIGDSLVKLAKDHDDVAVITAAMIDGTGLNKFYEKFPDRILDVGIAEAHAVCSAAGMALNGMKPYVCIYSTFLQRACDQIIHDVCLQNLPVTFCIDRAGVVPCDGETHQGIYDLSFLTAAKNLVICSPASLKEAEAMLKWSYDQDYPIAIRYPKGTSSIVDGDDLTIEKGKWRYLHNAKNEQIVLISNGALMASIAYSIAKEREDTSLIHASFINPLDEELLLKIKDKKIVVLEDVIETSNLFVRIASFYAKNHIFANIFSKAVKNMDIDSASVEEILQMEKLDKESIIKFIEKI